MKYFLFLLVLMAVNALIGGVFLSGWSAWHRFFVYLAIDTPAWIVFDAATD